MDKKMNNQYKYSNGFRKGYEFLRRLLILVMTAFMMLTSIDVNAIAVFAEENPDETDIFGFSGEKTEEENQETVEEDSKEEKSEEQKSEEENTSTEADTEKEEDGLVQQTVKATMTTDPETKEATKAPKKAARGKFAAPKSAGPEINLTGLLPEGAEVEAYPVTVSIPGEKVLVAYDITIYVPVLDEKGNTTGEREVWQPKDSVNVSVADAALANAGNVQIYHMDNKNAEPELIGTTTVEEGVVQFDAERFSIYVVGEESTDPRVHYRFWLDKTDINNNTPLNPQPYRDIALLDGETLLAPANPTDESRGKFEGWYTGNDQAFSCDGVTASISGDDDTYVDIYAKFDGAQYATFQSLYIDMKRTVFHTEKLTKTGDTYSLDLSNVPTYGAPVGYKFLGWSTTQPTDPLGYGENIPKENYYKPTDTITGLSGSVTLYPVAKKMYTVSLDGNGGTISGLPVYKVQVTNDDMWSDVLGTLTVQRAGYSRDEGWWDSADNSANLVTLSGEIDLSEDTVYYAHWTASTTHITIKYWKEPVEKNTETEKHPYELIDFEEIEVPTGTTLVLDKNSMSIGSKTLEADAIRTNIVSGGAKVNGGTFSADPDLKYFYTDVISAVDASGAYHSTDHPEYEGGLNVSVADDGSTIVDVWYNRKEYKLRFRFLVYSFLDDASINRNGTKKVDAWYPTDQSYQTIRLGESLSGKWPNVTDSRYNFSIYIPFVGNTGYSVVSLGKLTGVESFPDAVSDIFNTPLSYVNGMLLDCADGSNIQLWARYNNNTFKGGLQTATVTENYQRPSGSDNTISKSYRYGKGYSQDDAEPYTTQVYPGYVLDIQDTLSHNPNAYSVAQNPNGTISITYKMNGPYTANVYYDLAPFKVYLQYGDKKLTDDPITVYYQHNIQTALENSDYVTVFSNPIIATNLIPKYMEFGGWYTDESCNEGYNLTSSYTMPGNNVILYAKCTPINVTVKVDNGIETATETITDPQLNLSGSEMGSSIRYLNYQKEYGTDINYVAHTHTIAEFLPNYWATPVWENHVFTGWTISYDNGTTWSDLTDLNIPVDKSIMLKATWQDMTRHTIHYMVNGKEVYLDPEAYVEGSTVVIKGTDTEIYDKETGKTSVFRNWTDGSEPYLPGQEITMGSSDMTLTAVFEEGGITTGSEKATYTFMTPDGNGGWEKYYEEIVYRGERLSPPEDTPIGNNADDVFEGWYLDTALTKRFNGFGEAVSSPVDTTLYASFKRPWRVTYRGYDAESDGELITVQTYLHDGSENLNTMGVGADYTYKKGSMTYALIGWDTIKHEPGIIPTTYWSGYTDKKVTEDMTLYPVLEDGYWLTFHQDENMVTIPAVYYAKSQNLNFTWPDPDEVKRTDYTFTGKWYTTGNPEQQNASTEFNWNQTLTEDTTIYAGWNPNPNVTSQYTVVWWVEKADSNGDANDPTNYVYSNSVTKDGIELGESISNTVQVTSNHKANTAATSLEHADHLYENGNYVGQYFAVNSTLTDVSTTVVRDGSATINIYIQRKRYTITFNVNNVATIQYGGNDYTSWTVPENMAGWYGMPWAGKWPTFDGNGTTSPKLTMNTGLGYGSWSPSYGTTGAKTTPVIMDASSLDPNGSTLEYTLSALAPAANMFYAYYRFRDDTDSDYQDVDYNGKNYDQTFNTEVNLVHKDFAGYTYDSETATDSVYEFRFNDVNNPPYYTLNNRRNYVTFRAGTNGNKLDIMNSDGTQYTGSSYIYFYYNNQYTNNRYDCTADKIRQGNTTYVKEIKSKFTFYYTRQTRNLHIHNANGTEISQSPITLMVGESLAGKISDPSDYGINPPNDGMEFAGWSRSADSLVDVYNPEDTNATMPLYDIHYYLHWKDKQVIVTLIKSELDAAGNVAPMNINEDGTTVVYGPRIYGSKLSEFGLQNQELENYKFMGWLDYDTGEPIALTQAITENRRIIGDYRDLRSKELIYDLNGGTLKQGQSDPIEGTTLVSEGIYKDNDRYMVGASVPVKNVAAEKLDTPEGTVDFAYWNTDQEGKGESYYPNDAIEIPGGTDVTLYAIYTPVMETYLVYDLNYDNKPSPNVSVKFYDYREQGKPEGYLKVNDPYTVGTQLNTTSKVFEEIKYSGKTVNKLRPGYTFRGWDESNELADNAVPAYQNGNTIRVTPYNKDNGEYIETHTLYGYWKKDMINFKAYTFKNSDESTAEQIYDGTWWQDATEDLTGDMGKLFHGTTVTDHSERTGSGSGTPGQKPIDTATNTNYDFAYAKINGVELKGLQYVETADGYSWQYSTDGTTWTNVDDEVIDIYYSESLADLTIIKEVTGAMGDTTKNFTFTIVVAGMTAEELMAANSNVTGLSQTGNNPVTFSLKGGTTGNSITIKVPKNKSITITEANGFYTPTVTEVIATGGQSGLVTPTSGNALSENHTVGASGSTTATFSVSNNATLKFTNNLDSISPTGVHFTTLPYLLMLIAGMAFLLVSRKRKA